MKFVICPILIDNAGQSRMLLFSHRQKIDTFFSCSLLPQQNNDRTRPTKTTVINMLFDNMLFRKAENYFQSYAQGCVHYHSALVGRFAGNAFTIFVFSHRWLCQVPNYTRRILSSFPTRFTSFLITISLTRCHSTKVDSSSLKSVNCVIHDYFSSHISARSCHQWSRIQLRT